MFIKHEGEIKKKLYSYIPYQLFYNLNLNVKDYKTLFEMLDVGETEVYKKLVESLDNLIIKIKDNTYTHKYISQDIQTFLYYDFYNLVPY